MHVLVNGIRMRFSSLPALLVVVLVYASVANGSQDGSDLHPSARSLAAADSAYWYDLEHVVSGTSLLGFTLAPTLAVAPTPDRRMMMSFSFDQSGAQNPYYSVFNPTSKTWSNAAPINSSNQDIHYVTLAFDDTGAAHAAWHDGTNVYYAAEANWPGGATTLPSGSGQIIGPVAIAVGGDGIIHVVWAQGENLLAVFHAFSVNGGDDWTLSSPLNAAAVDASGPDIAITADNEVHVVWEQTNLITFEIHYRHATRSGSNYNWDGSSTLLSSGIERAKRPVILAEGNNLHLGFSRRDSTSEQYAYYRYRPAGGSWRSLINVNPDTPVAVNTSNPYFLKTTLAPCGSAVHLYYHGAGPDNVNEQIWAASSADNWQRPTAITDGSQRYIHPSLVCRLGMLHLSVERVQQILGGYDVYWGHEQKRVFGPIVHSQ